MKRIVLFTFVGLMVLTSCSKKSHPSASKPSKSREANTEAPVKIDAVPPSAPVTPPTTPPTASMAFASPMIVIDETGKIITTRDKLPAEIAAKVDYRKLTRSYTPAQRQNLIYRFKMLPPRVLFVPDHLVSKSVRGYYCVYKKKFWYWKKEDGLFHLDETYYQ